MNLRSGSTATMTVTNETLQGEIRDLSTNLLGRIKTLEDGFTQKIKDAVAELIETVRQEFEEKLQGLSDRVKLLENRPVEQSDSRVLSFVVYGMAESDDENVVTKVNDLLSTQLQLPNVNVLEAERKAKPEGRDAGVIVAKCNRVEDKRLIMEAKSKLNNTEHFSHIHIAHDKPRWQRQHEANMRMLVRSIGANKLYVKGNRLFEKQHPNNQWQNQGTGGEGPVAGRGGGQAAHRGARGRGAGRGTGRGVPRGAGRGGIGAPPRGGLQNRA